MTDQKYMRPGLKFAFGKLVEELGELSAIMGKTMRFGFYKHDPTKKVLVFNWQLIENEINDVLGAIENYKKEWDNTKSSEKVYMFGEE